MRWRPSLKMRKSMRTPSQMRIFRSVFALNWLPLTWRAMSFALFTILLASTFDVSERYGFQRPKSRLLKYVLRISLSEERVDEFLPSHPTL